MRPLFCYPFCPKDGGQRVTQGALEVGTTSSPVRISAYDRLSRPGARSEPQVCQRHHPGDDESHETRAMGAMTTAKNLDSVLKGQARRRLDVPYAMLVCQSVFKRQATSSSMTAKLTPASGWRITTSHETRAERTMTLSSSISS
jgi:hypothetical protein